MDETERLTGAEPKDKPLRRILMIAGIVLAVLVVLGVAIYAGVFLILAPMMQ